MLRTVLTLQPYLQIATQTASIPTMFFPTIPVCNSSLCKPGLHDSYLIRTFQWNQSLCSRHWNSFNFSTFPILYSVLHLPPHIFLMKLIIVYFHRRIKRLCKSINNRCQINSLIRLKALRNILRNVICWTKCLKILSYFRCSIFHCLNCIL